MEHPRKRDVCVVLSRVLSSCGEHITRSISSVDQTSKDEFPRWDFYLQGLRLTKQYIKGEENKISDSFSRLCFVSDINEYVHPLLKESIEQKFLTHLEEAETENVC